MPDASALVAAAAAAAAAAAHVEEMAARQGGLQQGAGGREEGGEEGAAAVPQLMVALREQLHAGGLRLAGAWPVCTHSCMSTNKVPAFP